MARKPEQLPKKVDGYKDPAAQLEDVIVERDDGVDVCSLYPRNCTDEMAATHWITATGDAFVDLESAR
ncbi:hypothetical protein ACFQGT_02085 [Natrialbaceae archaeon GCM10025810]|uniref:DUF7511 domain-containing protein n=1 Tax=Halovalidus salilacus TaxID=3075124 RepID=UPI003622E71B